MVVSCVFGWIGSDSCGNMCCFSCCKSWLVPCESRQVIGLVQWKVMKMLLVIDIWYISGQNTATSHDLTPKNSWGREMGPLISGKSRLVKHYFLPRYISLFQRHLPCCTAPEDLALNVGAEARATEGLPDDVGHSDALSHCIDQWTVGRLLYIFAGEECTIFWWYRTVHICLYHQFNSTGV